MSTDYDPSGQRYRDRALPVEEVLYEVHLRLASASSVVDPADILVFDWEYEATPEDRFEFVATGVEGNEGEPVPREFALYQNYPNPFNACTRIRFCLNRPGRVTVRVFNVLGQRVRTLLDRRLDRGTHEIQWDGTDDAGRSLGSGVYLIRLRRGGESRRVKAVLLR